MDTIKYRELKENEINLTIFNGFNRYQDVKKCWRKENNELILKDIAFTEQWSLDEYKYLVECLLNTIRTGGTVFGAFNNDVLVGFASMESEFLGSHKEYSQLSSIHISYDQRGKGIGKRLFNLSCQRAKDMGAKKLYISAHSSEETQAFYTSMSCIEAMEYNEKLVDLEPCDCQLNILYNLALLPR